MTSFQLSASSSRSVVRRPSPAPNKSLQADQAKLSRLLLTQEPRQLVFAARLPLVSAASLTLYGIAVYSGCSVSLELGCSRA